MVETSTFIMPPTTKSSTILIEATQIYGSITTVILQHYASQLSIEVIEFGTISSFIWPSYTHNFSSSLLSDEQFVVLIIRLNFKNQLISKKDLGKKMSAAQVRKSRSPLKLFYFEE